MEKPHVAIFPLSHAMGHFLPLAEFANRLSHFHASSSITLIISRWRWASQQPAVLQRLASSGLDIHFTEIPTITENEDEQNMQIPERLYNFMLKAKPHIEVVLQSLSSSSPVSAFITDLFCTELLDVTSKLKIPSYIFVPASASFACFVLHFPKLDSEIEISFKDADFEVEIPGLPLVPARDLLKLSPVQDRSSPGLKWMLDHACRFREASGVLINTFAELEEEAIKTLSRLAKPSIYSIGPLMSTESDAPAESGRSLKWLDQQPPFSVLFVAFGSRAVLPREQITDLAIGLEASGHRFLWVLRGYNSEGSTSLETDISELLPEGFESRTRPRACTSGLGSSGSGSFSPVYWRLPFPLRMELNSGERLPRSSYDRLASVRGTGDEQGHTGEADSGSHRFEDRSQWICEERRSGKGGEGIDGRRRGKKGEGESERVEGQGQDGYDGRGQYNEGHGQSSHRFITETKLNSLICFLMFDNRQWLLLCRRFFLFVFFWCHD